MQSTLKSFFKVAFLMLLLGILTLSANPVEAAVNLPVPFTSQAPTGNWRRPYQDFCEEASVVMAAHFVFGTPLTAFFADLQMKLIKMYEDLVFGRSKDNSAEEVAAILKNLYRLKNIQMKEIKTVQDIRTELSAGKIVIAPVAGRLLGNPYFTPPGPRYHMVVVKGFDDKRGVFITNDPGTRRGADYLYTYHTLLRAIHDLNNGDVLAGKKTVIVVGR